MKKINPLNIIEFEVTDEMYDKYIEFINNKKETYFGAIGGRFSLQITPTSLGTIYVIADELEKTELNLTDFESW